MFRAGFVFITLTLLAQAAFAQKGPAQRVQESIKNKPALEMVFVLDTTGSMGGLIDGAKQKIWAIVNDVMKSQSKPIVRIGLVAYRDHGDQYVTKVLPLTRDLDKVYSTLMDYRADGGGDTPEDVRQALADGVSKAGWSQRSSSIAQILFLVGDAPPHDDYGQEPSTDESVASAVRRGIIFNAIQCGEAADTREVWSRLARRGEGEYFAIAQDGGVQTVATPYDTELTKLGGKIGTTYLAFGGGGGMAGVHHRAALSAKQAEVESKVALRGPAGAAADRAYNKAINAFGYEGDLLTSVENGSVKLDAIKAKDLPDNLKKLSVDDRKKEVGKMIADRGAIRKQIVELSRKRDDYIATERKKKASAGNKGFDAAVSATLKKQAARRGIHI